MSRADTVVASVRLTCSTCTADGAAGGVITGSATAMRPINAVTAAPGSTRRPISVSVAPACSPSGNTLRRHAPLTPPRPSTFSTAPIRSTACSRDGPAPVRWTISNWLSPVSFNDVANSRTSLADRGVPVIFSAVPPSYGSSQSSDGTTLVPVPVTLHRHVGSTSCSDRLCHACVERTVPVDRELLPVPGVEVRHERQRGDRRQLGDVVGDALPRGGRRGVRRVAVRADPEPVVPRVEVGGARRRLESPLRTVEAEGRRVRFALGEDRRPAYARVVAVRLDVHTGREVVRAAAQLPGERRRVRQALRAPPEVEEHLVRLLEERPVPGGQRVLPGDAAGVGHRVVPDDPQPAPADVPDEVTHVLCELGVAAGRLLVEEPAVEPVVPRDLDHLVRHREPVAVALHEVADPLEPAAVRVRREEHVAEHAHPVAVRGVGDGRVRREDQALGRGIAPEHQFVDVLPVVRGVVVHVERPGTGCCSSARTPPTPALALPRRGRARWRVWPGRPVSPAAPCCGCTSRPDPSPGPRRGSWPGASTTRTAGRPPLRTRESRTADRSTSPSSSERGTVSEWARGSPLCATGFVAYRLYGDCIGRQSADLLRSVTEFTSMQHDPGVTYSRVVNM